MIFLVEFDVHDGTSLTKLYVGTLGVRTGPTDTPANQWYEPRMSSVGRLERSMFGNGDGVSAGTTGGVSEVGFGNISVLNGTAAEDSDLIDSWLGLAFRNVTIRSLKDENQPFVQAKTRFVGTIEQLVSTNALEQFDLIIHDRLSDLDKPLLIATYLGTTTSGGLGTVEGDTDLKDQIKQKLWGTVHNVDAIAVNAFDLVWQISDGPVNSITVFDGGVGLINDGNVGTLAALFAPSVALGHYITCLNLGLFRLGSPPQGDVTCDVVEGATAADRTAGQIAKRMMAWFGANYGVTVTPSNSDIAALDAANSAQCGIIVKETENALAAVMRVLNSVGAWMLPQSDNSTMFDLGRLDPPSGAAVASYDLDDCTDTPQRVESGDEGKGIPAWKVIVKYDQLDVVQQSADLFGIVTENDPVRVQYLATEWRQASAQNNAVLTQWPNAPTLTVETRLLSQADAQAEANRLLTSYSAKRDIWRIVVPMSDDPLADPGIGEVVELTSRAGRMGMGPEPGLGLNYRVIGRADDFDNVPLLTLTLWR